jgi:hypothetical protein
MFVIKLHLFSIGTIIVPTHIEHIPKPICLLDIIMAKPILNQPIILVNVLAMKLVVPPNIAKQHSPETFFHPKVGEMIIDETPAWEQIQDLTIIGWTIDD